MKTIKSPYNKPSHLIYSNVDEGSTVCGLDKRDLPMGTLMVPVEAYEKADEVEHLCKACVDKFWKDILECYGQGMITKDELLIKLHIGPQAPETVRMYKEKLITLKELFESLGLEPLSTPDLWYMVLDDVKALDVDSRVRTLYSLSDDLDKAFQDTDITRVDHKGYVEEVKDVLDRMEQIDDTNDYIAFAGQMMYELRSRLNNALVLRRSADKKLIKAMAELEFMF